MDNWSIYCKEVDDMLILQYISCRLNRWFKYIIYFSKNKFIIKCNAFKELKIKFILDFRLRKKEYIVQSRMELFKTIFS